MVPFNKQTNWKLFLRKGFYSIPEIGEEILIGFEGGNAEKPFVMGTHYNGSETNPHYTSD